MWEKPAFKAPNQRLESSFCRRTAGQRLVQKECFSDTGNTANLRTKILDFRGFDSSRILSLRGGILMSMGSSPVIQSQQLLVRGFLVRGLTVVIVISAPQPPPPPPPGGCSAGTFYLVKW